MQTTLKTHCIEAKRRWDQEHGSFESATFRSGDNLVYIELPDATKRFTVGAQYDITVSPVHPVTGA